MIRGFATTAGNLESEQVVTSNTLMNDMSKAEELSPNETTTYTSLIDSLCKHDRFDDAYYFVLCENLFYLV
jgi:hypothetical protein